MKRCNHTPLPLNPQVQRKARPLSDQAECFAALFLRLQILRILPRNMEVN
jgi:hypothetical protein